MEFLYHGSIAQDITVLEPRKRFTPAGKIEYAAIYASPLPIIAAVHAFPWSSDEGIDFALTDDQRLILSIPKQYVDRLEQSISIYKISSESFQHTIEDEVGYT